MIRTNCPTDDELRAFGSGRLSSEVVDKVAQHVEECADCESRLGQFDDSMDEFVAGLRGCATSAEDRKVLFRCRRHLQLTPESASANRRAECWCGCAASIPGERMLKS